MKSKIKIAQFTIKISRTFKLTSPDKSCIPALFFLNFFIFFQVLFPEPLFPRKFRLTAVHEGFQSPVHAVFTTNQKQIIYVVEQRGRIIRIQEGKRSVFLDISDTISSGGELGLLSMALPSSYSEIQGDVFYVNYTSAGPLHTIIAEIPVKQSNPPSADFSHKRVLLKFAQPYSNHNGGLILFGPDGYLYIGSGDGGSAGDPNNNAQNSANLLGKILKIHPAKTGFRPYGIAPDAPVIKKALPEIYAMGLRNPWRFSFDRKTGDLYAGDVGQNRIEEIDLIKKGENYGWRIMEGNLCYRPVKCESSSFMPPIHTYGRDEGISVTGGYVYRGQKIPEFYGKYIFADYGSGNVWALPLSSSGKASGNAERIMSNAGRISSFAEDAEGELYLIDHGEGKIMKIEY